MTIADLVHPARAREGRPDPVRDGTNADFGMDYDGDALDLTSDVADALDDRVSALALDRARRNGRRTVTAADVRHCLPLAIRQVLEEFGEDPLLPVRPGVAASGS